MLITIPSILCIPLIIAILITLYLYIEVSKEDVIDNLSEALSDAVCYSDTWLIRKYGVAGCVFLRRCQAVREQQCRAMKARASYYVR